MNKKLTIFAAIILISGCTAHKADLKTEHYESSTATCASDGKDLNCDWDNVTDDWNQASASIFKTKQDPNHSGTI